MKAFLKDNVILVPSPINLDRAIQEIQIALGELTWIQKVYGRARTIPEKVNSTDGKTVVLPKVYMQQKEYLNVFLNDNVSASSWFQLTGPEIPLDYAPGNTIQKYQAPVALILWFNLELTRLNLTDADDYIHTELLKREVHNKIGRYPNVTITKVYDEHAKDIFREYTFEVDREQFLTYPKAALRFDFFLTYDYDAICA